ncbi:MAG: PAS domain-containing protein, partial [Ignavibacterium sp.]
MLKNKSRQDLFKLLEYFNSAVLLFDEGINLLHYNVEALQIFTKDILEESKSSDINSDKLNSLISGIKKRILNFRETFFFEFDIQDFDSPKVFHLIINRLSVADSIYFLCQITEIEKDRIESLFNKLFDSTSDIILLIEPNDFKILDANDNAVRYYKISRYEIIGSDFISLSRLVE